MQLITALQSADDLADLANLANTRSRIAVFNKDETLRFHSCRGVVIVIGNIAGPVFDEVIIRIVTGSRDAVSSLRKKRRLLCQGHVQINCLEEPAAREAAAQISEDRICRALPLLHVE